MCEGPSWSESYVCDALDYSSCSQTPELSNADSGTSFHCLGRVACRDPMTGELGTCDPDIASYEGLDCFVVRSRGGLW